MVSPRFFSRCFLAQFAIFAQTRQIFREGVFSFATRNFHPAVTSYSIQFGSSRLDSKGSLIKFLSDKSGEKRTREERGRQTLEITGVRQAAPGSLAFFSIDRLIVSATIGIAEQRQCRFEIVSNQDLSECYPSEIRAICRSL